MLNATSALVGGALLSWLIPALTLFAVQPAAAFEQILFESSQFGAVDLIPKQSASGALQLVETLGAQSDRFEPISDFRIDDPIRVLGRAVGRLDILVKNAMGREGVSICTATLIAPDKIITNHHCIPGEGGTRVLAAKIRFGYLELGSTSSIAFDVDIKPLETNPQLDYSILRVTGDPAANFAIMPLKLRRVVENERLFIIHHPAGQPQRLTRAFCRAYPKTPVFNGHVRHQCDTLPGSSGSLLLAQADNAFVGLHHAGGLTPIDPKSFNEGIDAVVVWNMSKVLEALSPTNPHDVPSPPPPPPSLDSNLPLKDRAAAYLAAREWDHAVEAFTQAIALDPKDPVLLKNLGAAHLGKQDYGAAIKDYDAAIALDPEYAEHYYNRGVAYFGKRDYDAAIKNFSEAIRLDFYNKALAYYLRGEAKQHTRDHAGGKADMAKARKIDPNVGK